MFHIPPSLYHGLQWSFFDKRYDMRILGYLPDLLSTADPRGVAEQLNHTYAHGGGWREMNRGGENYSINPKTFVLRYRLHGGEYLHPIAKTQLRDETLVFYPYAIIAVLKGDRLNVSRVD